MTTVTAVSSIFKVTRAATITTSSKDTKCATVTTCLRNVNSGKLKPYFKVVLLLSIHPDVHRSSHPVLHLDMGNKHVNKRVCRKLFFF